FFGNKARCLIFRCNELQSSCHHSSFARAILVRACATQGRFSSTYQAPSAGEVYIADTLAGRNCTRFPCTEAGAINIIASSEAGLREMKTAEWRACRDMGCSTRSVPIWTAEQLWRVLAHTLEVVTDESVGEVHSYPPPTEPGATFTSYDRDSSESPDRRRTQFRRRQENSLCLHAVWSSCRNLRRRTSPSK